MKVFRYLCLSAVIFLGFTHIASAQEVSAQEEPASAQEEPAFGPSSTHKFAQRDTCELFLDIYDPAPGSQTSIDGREKPTIVFVFGGGFLSGTRNNPFYMDWFKALTDNGYRVVANDYRLGLKGVKKMGVSMANVLHKAIDIAVEDLYSATGYLIDHAGELGIDPSNLVISGSSAGAITSLQAQWYLCNDAPISKVLPEGFSYAGVMAFAGAIFSDQGAVKYKKEPSPILMLHGIDDRIVTYEQISFAKLHFSGANVLAKVLKKGDYNYNIYRFEGYGHEISMVMAGELHKEFQFLEENVMKGKKAVIDATVNFQGYPHFKNFSKLSDLYK